MRGSFVGEIYIHFLLLGIAIIHMCSCECSTNPTILNDATGSVSTKGFLKRLNRNQKCKWKINVPDNYRKYRFTGQLTGRDCRKKRLTVKVNGDDICSSEGTRTMKSDCLVSPALLIEYKNEKGSEGFSLTYNITPCFDIDGSTTSIKATPETSVVEEGDVTTTAQTNNRPQALIEVFVPILVLLLAAIIGLIVYIKCRRKENDDKDNISTQMTDLTTVTSQNTAQDASGYHNEGFYASIDEGVQTRPTDSAAQEQIPDRNNRQYYEITEISNGNVCQQNEIIATTQTSRNESATDSESTVVANILYGSS